MGRSKASFYNRQGSSSQEAQGYGLDQRHGLVERLIQPDHCAVSLAIRYPRDNAVGKIPFAVRDHRPLQILNPDHDPNRSALNSNLPIA